MKDDRLYIEHILECIGRIEEYCQGGEQASFQSQIVQDAVLRNLQILTESATRLSPDDLCPEHRRQARVSLRCFTRCTSQVRPVSPTVRPRHCSAQ